MESASRSPQGGRRHIAINVQLARAELAAQVAEENFVLSDGAYAAVRAFHDASLHHRWDLGVLTPEYGRAEYLINVNAVQKTGAEPTIVSNDARVHFQKAVEMKSPFARWFEFAQLPEGPTLLVARWLAHTAGFRHRVIHIFLEHPTNPDYLFAQFRSLAKANAPGCFDVAIGGHRSGTTNESDTIREEVQEELGLQTERDLAGLEPIGSYEYRGAGQDEEIVNVEFRTVYRARITEEAISRVHFHDGEVAALCLFSRRELESLLNKAPERFASGMRESYGVYKSAHPTVRSAGRE